MYRIPRENVTDEEYDNIRSAVEEEICIPDSILNEHGKIAIDICTEMFIEHLLCRYNSVDLNDDKELEIDDMADLFRWIIGKSEFLPIEDEDDWDWDDEDDDDDDIVALGTKVMNKLVEDILKEETKNEENSKEEKVE